MLHGGIYHHPMSQDSTYMRLALEHALQAKANGEIPVGAVVVKEGQVIGVGANAPIACHDPSAHAEMVALRAAAAVLGNYRLEGCELFVTLEPCPMCAGAIMHSRIRRLVFGALDPKTGAAGSVINLFANPQLNHHTQVEAGLLSQDCSEMLSSFFKQRRQEKATTAEPLQDNALRTPPESFANLPSLGSASQYFQHRDATQGWRLHYLEEGAEGAGVTVVCLHAIPGWGYRYQALIPALRAVGVRVLVPDMIGFGKSDKPKKASAHTVDMHVASLLGWLAHAGTSSRLVFLTSGAGGAELAQLLCAHSSGAPRHIWRLPSIAPDAADQAPYPDKGYKAGLSAASSLVQELGQRASTIPGSLRTPIQTVNGSPNEIAHRLWSAALR